MRSASVRSRNVKGGQALQRLEAGDAVSVGEVEPSEGGQAPQRLQAGDAADAGEVERGEAGQASQRLQTGDFSVGQVDLGRWVAELWVQRNQ